MLLKVCHKILVLEVIRDSCSRQRVGTVRQRVCSVHYQFKLPFIWKEYNQYAHNKIWGEIFNCFAIF